jgi:mono/diheme cytochrome c family protein
MRELIARGVCGLALAVVVALSLLFAARHNRGASAEGSSEFATLPSPPEKPHASASEIVRGRMVFQEQNCTACHSIEGTGNPRYPLDGVADRLKAGELPAWITGTGQAAGLLPASIVKRKQRYQQLPETDLNALVAFLSSVKSGSE